MSVGAQAFPRNTEQQILGTSFDNQTLLNAPNSSHPFPSDFSTEKTFVETNCGASSSFDISGSSLTSEPPLSSVNSTFSSIYQR